MNRLLPLYLHPAAEPAAWDAVCGHPESLTVVVNVAGGPGPGLDPVYTAAIGRLTGAGVTVLGVVDLTRATRPVGEVRVDVGRWAGYRVDGIFFDQVPTSPFSIGPVAAAVRAARRVGLGPLLLNPGVPPDRRYRDLDATVCAYEGPWARYRAWAGAGARPGDAHLVYGVPVPELPVAWQLMADRGARYGLATDRAPPYPYAGLPAWCSLSVAR
jgi:hypothetical protein